MRIIPAIEILNGKVVQLRGGLYNEVTEYNLTIDQLANQFQSQGTDYVQIIDLNGAKGDFSNQKFVVNSLQNAKLKIQYGGGVRSIEKIKKLIDLGIHRVIVGTQAITDAKFLQELASEICGKNKCSDEVILAVDVLDEVIKYSGWEKTSNINLFDYLDTCTSLGFFRFLCTDIRSDGKLQGPNSNLYKKIKENFPFIKLIASGGITSMRDVESLEDAKVESCVIGKAFYEGKIKLEDIKEWNLRSLVSF